MRNLCIIPARGGSKRIPRKNIKNFHGKPIIAYSIELALQSVLFDDVMVSTDDNEIAEIAKKYGADVPFFRSDVNANDIATTVDVLLEVINQYQSVGKKYDNICCLYPTAPLVQISDLSNGLKKLTSENVDTVFPMVPFSYPIWRGLKKNNNTDVVEMLWPEYQSKRSQDLEEIFHDAGQWYWLKVNNLLYNKRLFTKKSAGVILNPLQVQDIDNSTDWKIAEIKYEIIQGIKQ
jgi:pseudaminic acid cytidylyltransferase